MTSPTWPESAYNISVHLTAVTLPAAVVRRRRLALAAALRRQSQPFSHPDSPDGGSADIPPALVSGVVGCEATTDTPGFPVAVMIL